MTRRPILIGLVSAIATLGVLSIPSCAPNQSQADNPTNSGSKASPDPVASPVSTESATLRVGFISTESKVPIGPEGWAQEKGWLNQELQNLGITAVKFIPFDGGPALNEAIASGQLDLALYGDTPALVGKSAGLPTSLINQTRVGQDAWLLTRQDGPKSLSELKGQKVGVAKGTYPHRYLLGLLEQEGLSKEVKVVQIKSAEAKAALERGDIAAYPFAMGAGPALIEKGFSAIDQAKNHTGLVGTGVSIITNPALAKYPTLPNRWNQLRQKALAEIKAKPEEFHQFAARVSGGVSLDNAKQSYPLSLYPEEPFTPEGLKLLNSTKQFLADQKLLKSDFNIDDWKVAKP